MPTLTEEIERTGFTPPLEKLKEDDGDRGKGSRMILIGVEKNTFEKESKIDDWLKYNFSVLITQLEEKPMVYSNFAIEDVEYLFIDEKNKLYSRYFDYCFLCNLEGKWYTLMLHDEKTMLNRIKSSKKIIAIKDVDTDINFLEEFIAELTVSLLKERGIKPTGNPLIFRYVYLGEKPIIIDCEKTSPLEISGIKEPCYLDKKSFNKIIEQYPIEHKKYLAKKIMPYEKEFSKFSMLNIDIEDLPTKIAHYSVMDLYGKEIERSK